MKNLALPRIQAMKPYEPPLDGRSVFVGLLLDFNERTTAPAIVITKQPQLYPEYFDLTQEIADYAEVDAGQVMITNGTDQAIDIIFRTFADRDDMVIIPEPTFAMYRQYALVNGNRILSPNYDEKLHYPIKEVLDSLGQSPKIVIICNPNNPTGTLVDLSEIERIARLAQNTVVYIDEAYFEFSGVTAVQLVRKYPNIIVSRTFSKAFGLAGLRIGYIIANKQYITEILKVRGPYDVNQVAAQTASAALRDRSATTSYVREVMDEAKPLTEQFFGQNNIPYYPSQANFILFKPSDAASVAKTLRENGILVRPQNKPGIKNSLRITIGTLKQMQQFIEIYNTAVLDVVQKYALLDRDGTLIFEPQDTYQIDSLDKLRLLDGTVEGLQRLQNDGYRLVIVSNQDGLGTPSFPQADFEAPQTAMLKTFEQAGIRFEQIFICAHKPGDNCNCRKPKTGLVDDWLNTVGIDREQSFVCGDRLTDRQFAERLGLNFVPMTTNGDFNQAIAAYFERRK